MKKITKKLVEANFLIRMLGERIYSGMANPKDVRDTRKKVNSILKEIGVLVKENGG